MKRLFVCMFVFFFAHACSPGGASEQTTQETNSGDATDKVVETAPEKPSGPLLGELKDFQGRAFDIIMPDNYNAQKKYTLLLVLHGYGGNSGFYPPYLGLQHIKKQDVIILLPNGLVDTQKKQFWSATDTCCGVTTKREDDHKYLKDMIERALRDYSIDPTRVFMMGHSNGGFMSYSMACKHADMIAGVISIAGASFYKKEDCNPSKPVHILQIHGTSDKTVLYAGGQWSATLPPYPGVDRTLKLWSEYNQCKGTIKESSEEWDLISGGNNNETKPSQYQQCPNNGQVHLWKLNTVGHLPLFNGKFVPKVWEWIQQAK